MPAQANVNEILQEVSTLSLEDQGFIVQTIMKRLHELRRIQIAERAKEFEWKAQRVLGFGHHV